MIPASPSPRLDDDSEKKTPDTSGPSSLDAFAFFDRDSSSWKMCQATLFSDSIASLPIWPKSGMTRGGYAYELPMSAPPTDENGSSALLATPTTSDMKGPSPNHTGTLAEHIALLPTPSAYESTPTEEFVEEMQEADIRPDRRLYMPGRKWHSQRTLSRIAPALLPTPGANDMTGGEGPTREARQEKGTGGPALRDIGHLLPTPQKSDGDGGRITGDPETLRTGWRPSGSKASVPLATAIHAGVSLTDALRTGETTPPRLSTGEPTSQPSDDGSPSPASPPQNQLTIEDA